ncbi:MAG: nucleotidyltransferase domain-containing protein, partial [Armatimonadetes bacterium]|nr:nucleotidyltransferase domain-containing protein [Armatimonadota bacterium]
MAEVKSAIPLEEIQRVVNEIVEKFKPQRVILFGSQAKGEAKEESDLDLLIVMDFDNPSRLEMAHLIRSSIEAPKQDWMGHKVCAWLDIHVYSPSEF